MRHRWIVLCLAVVAALSAFSFVVPSLAQTTGVLEGQVVNGTAGGPAIGAGLPVILHGFRGDAEVSSLETTTDAQGKFRFEGLDTDPALEYWPEVVYLDVAYAPDEPVQFDGAGTELASTVTVYETTTDDAGIRIDSVHMIVESFDQVLRVSEIHLVGNAGDRTYVGTGAESGQGETILVPLPADAVGLSFGESMPADRFLEVEAGLRDTEPVPPGRETALVFFSYHLMVGGDTVPLERRFAYPLNSLSLLVAQPGLTVRSAQMESQGVQLFQGREYELYVVGALPAETAVSMDLVPVAGGQSMPATPGEGAQVVTSGSTRGNQDLMRSIGFGLAVLAVVAAVAYPFTASRPAKARRGALDLNANPRARQMISELVDLEESYEAGEIDAVVYEERRSRLEKAVKAL
jgi:hypothetical protein